MIAAHRKVDLNARRFDAAGARYARGRGDGAARRLGGRAKRQATVKAYNESGYQLFAKLAVKPGNLVISPYSIGTAMAMALAGAGETQSQMAKVLQQTLSADDIADVNKRLNGLLTAQSDGQAAGIAIANAFISRARRARWPAPTKGCSPTSLRPNCSPDPMLTRSIIG